MKRKFLVLSVTMLTVCGAALLQSCSSEFEYYDTTSEYGYYTEEEIAAIKALGKMYDSDLNVNENYYGEKLTLPEIERSIIDVLSLEGEYEFTISEQNKETHIYHAEIKRKGTDIQRSKTRSSESSLPIQGTVASISGDPTPCKLTISWRYNTNRGNVVYYTVEQPYYLNLEGHRTIYDYNAKFIGNSISIDHTLYFYKKGIHVGSFLIHGTYSSNLNALTITKVKG